MKFRELTTKAGTKILAGRDARNNEELIAQIKPDEDVFHTESPGSPFVNIKGKPKRGDIKTAAIFCAAYSQIWRDNKKDVAVHRFKGKDIYKTRAMSLGTFGVRKKTIIKVKKTDIRRFRDETIRS